MIGQPGCTVCKGTGRVIQKTTGTINIYEDCALCALTKGQSMANQQVPNGTTAPAAPQTAELSLADALKEVASSVGSAYWEATKIEGAGEVAKGLYQAARAQFAEDEWPRFLDTPFGRLLVMAGLPAIIQIVVKAYPQLPQAKLIEAVAALAIKGVAHDQSKELVQKAMPFIGEVVKLGMGAMAQGLLTAGQPNVLPPEAGSGG